MQTPASKENLTLKEALEFLASRGIQTSYRSLKRWIGMGILKVSKVRARTRWISRASLDEFSEGKDPE